MYKDNIDVELLKQLFVEAKTNFIKENMELIKRDIHERCLCANLAFEIKELLAKYNLDDYYVDVEYNRDGIDRKECIYFKDKFDEKEKKFIICDLVLHNRKSTIDAINLIALEMKKINAPKEEKTSDRKRLEALTSQGGSFNYILGVYYELSVEENDSVIEYYVNGKSIDYK